MYAYSVRDAGNPEFHKALLEHITPLIPSLDYPSLHNLIYTLIFHNNTNEETWKQIVETTIANPDTLPIMNYKPFKTSYYYLKSLFPHWDEF